MDDLFNISLHQGKQFKNYQKKLFKRKENFTTYDTSTDNDDLNNYNELKSQYDNVSQQYQTLQQQSLQNVHDFSQPNPYLNKTIRFTTGHVAYVTNEGYVKYIPTMEVWNFIGAPYSYIDVPIPWLNEYGNPGVTIPTTPPLTSGTFATYQTVGNEGKSVYVDKLLNTITSSYVGAYNDLPVVNNALFVPVIPQSNVASNNMAAYCTSVLDGNNEGQYGAWAAFDRDANTFWHSQGDRYDWNTGDVLSTSPVSGSYIDANGNSQPIVGEYLMITMPDFWQSGNIKYVLTKYDLRGRIGYPMRGPNNWVILGARGPAGPSTNWIELDRQTDQAMNVYNSSTYTVSNKTPCCAFLIMTTNIGTNEYGGAGNRGCLQISIWNLYTNSNQVDTGYTNDQNAMNYSGYDNLSFNECQQYAADNGNPYFAIQDVNTSTSTGKCVVSNDDSSGSFIKYGDAATNPSYTAEVIWAVNDTWGTDASQVFITDDGSLAVANNAGTVIWRTPPSADCINGGKINLDTLTATYGGNCDGNNGWSIVQNNALDKVKQTYIDQGYPAQMSFPVNNGNLGDPAPGCGKGWDTSYQCGTEWKSTHIDYAEGQNYIYDCSEKANSCQFFLVLQDDGNMCVYNGTQDSSNWQGIWCTSTNGKQKEANPEWATSNGKYGSPFFKQGQTLAKGEWIGSNDGSTKLLFQEDGNLVLYTSTKTPYTQTVGDKTYGTSGINAVYKLDKMGDPASIGKIGYVDSNSVLMEYPDSMLNLSNNYTFLPSVDSPYNDLGSWGNMTQEDCQTKCNENNDCHGYAYVTTTQTCWIKDKNMYPRGGLKIYNPDITLGIRQPMLTGSQTCGTDIAYVDTLQYDNYLKGPDMTPDTRCHPNAIPPETQSQMNNLEDQMNGLAQQMSTDTSTNYGDDVTMFNNLKHSQHTFHKKANNYKDTKKEIKKINYQNNTEGMITMNDANQMVTDTNLIVLKNNYIYMIWVALALFVILITVSVIRKS